MTDAKRSLRARSAALLLSLAGAAGCRNGSAEARQALGTSPQGTAERAVAYVGNEPISLAEIEAPVAHEIYALRTVALQKLLAKRLIIAEARRRGITPQELLRIEIEQKVETPTDSQLREFFLQAQAEGRIEADKSFDAAKDGFRQARVRAMQAEREQALVRELSAKAQVRIDLNGLGRPAPPPRDSRLSVGSADAPVVLVEYTDFKSPFCKQGHATVKRLREKYPKTLRVIFRQKPELNDEQSFHAAEAALCAFDQNQYWPYRELLFEHQNNLTEAALVAYAREAGLSEPSFRECLSSGKHRRAIEEDMNEARDLGYEGSPVFSLGGTRLSGAHEYETFAELIETELAWRGRRPEPS
jgi:predicted DsbA family dithiol-disulfide isomerase